MNGTLALNPETPMMRFLVGDRVMVVHGSGCDSGVEGTVVDRGVVPLRHTGGGIIPDLPGYFKPMTKDEVAVRRDDGTLLTMFPERLVRVSGK